MGMFEDDWERKVQWMRERHVRTAAWDGSALVECELGPPQPEDAPRELESSPEPARPVFPVPTFGSRLTYRKSKDDDAG